MVEFLLIFVPAIISVQMEERIKGNIIEDKRKLVATFLLYAFEILFLCSVCCYILIGNDGYWPQGFDSIGFSAKYIFMASVFAVACPFLNKTLANNFEFKFKKNKDKK